MRYTVNIIVSIKDVIKKMDIEIPEYISNIQSFYLYLKEKCDLPQVNQGEVCICSKDKNRDITLFVITDTESVLYSPFEDISMFASIFPLYISYCSTIARAVLTIICGMKVMKMSIQSMESLKNWKKNGFKNTVYLPRFLKYI